MSRDPRTTHLCECPLYPNMKKSHHPGYLQPICTAHGKHLWTFRVQDQACLPHEDSHVLCVPLAPSVLGHGIATVCSVVFASFGLLSVPWLSGCFWRRALAEKRPRDHSILSCARLSTERGFPSFLAEYRDMKV